MKTYTDADVIAVLASRVAGSSYRAIADELGVDFAYLCRAINGDIELPESIAVAAGYSAIPQPTRTWKRVRKEAA
jgi:hypothetical protein